MKEKTSIEKLRDEIYKQEIEKTIYKNEKRLQNEMQILQ